MAPRLMRPLATQSGGKVATPILISGNDHPHSAERRSSSRQSRALAVLATGFAAVDSAAGDSAVMANCCSAGGRGCDAALRIGQGAAQRRSQFMALGRRQETADGEAL